MTETNVFQLSQPGTFADPLTEVLRNGARALLAQAVEAEVAALLGCHADKLTDDGRQRLVRHGHLPEREIMSRVGEGGERIRFSSAILPPSLALLCLASGTFTICSNQKYYNEARTQLSLRKDTPISRTVQSVGHVLPMPILGGLHQYIRV